ncbi:MAG: histidinol dehydrogenase [Bacteroidales bacterium]|nr:histidinol dehydrogenase [Bacteroidales bacterium]
MRIFIEPHKDQWPFLVKRVRRDDSTLDWRVTDILHRVKEGGDAALINIITEIEGQAPSRLKVTPEEFSEAEKLVPDELKTAILEAKSRITAFHGLQTPKSLSWNDGMGIVCVRRSLPLPRVGLYIPGGTAPLFSTVLMLGVPSGIAGCPERIICTPPSKDGKVAPAILFAAQACGITDVFKVGGAQAIAAMAYGTGTIDKVDKVFGPGNRYVLKAKQLICKEGIAIDMPAGPSEVMVIADSSADVRFVASDMLSQAEHGPDSQVILVCGDYSFARAVQAEIKRQKESLPRKDVVDKALIDSRIIVINDPEEQLEFANYYAPEHLILSVKDQEAAAGKVKAAGSVFLGNFTPESAGDYASGTNHILPTSGRATAWSGIGVESFMHSVTYQSITQEGLFRIGEMIITMAEAEGLKAHANAVRLRLSQNLD